MNPNPVIELLEEQIGLSPSSLGLDAVSSAIEGRMRTVGDGSPESYAMRLRRDPEEFQLLIHQVCVPETWFFRGGEVFTFLAHLIADATRQRSSPEPFRVLSIPCSSGEEPYSLAIALLELGVAPERWLIEGVDLDARLIGQARTGRFSKFSFRQTPVALRDRYFQPVAGAWQLIPSVRSLVQFRQGNLLSPHFLAVEKPYDLIFCRNLLIYLHPAARKRAIEMLSRWLTPRGLLAVGHAEPLDTSDRRFASYGPQAHFLYERVLAPMVEVRIVEQSVPNRKFPRPGVPPARPAPSAEIDLLAQAREHADRAEFDAALACCRKHAAKCGSSAQLFTLMGQIHLARHDQGEAARFFQSALYLEPAQPEALTHLMLLCQEQGQHEQAARLKRRLQRATQGGEP